MRPITRAEAIYGAVMGVGGCCLGLLAPRYPAFFEQVPALVALLGFGLIADLGLHAAAQRGQGEPLTMPARFIAFMMGAIIMLMLSSAFAKAA